MEPDFMKIPVAERENILMPEIINALRNLGGYASRKEIIKELKTSSDAIPEDYIEFSRESSKSGKEYKPFNFQFNFSINNLDFSGFVNIPKRGQVELTEKGREVELSSLDIEKDIHKLAAPEWEKRSKSKKLDKSLSSEEYKTDNLINHDEISEEVEMDTWEVKLKKALKAMHPQKFELFARRLVKEMGVDIDEKIGISFTNDGGLDGFGYITSGDFRTTRVAIQAKRWEGNVSAPEIDKFRGAMDKYNAEFGIFITTSNFTREAIRASRIGTRVITLINGDEIVDLVAKYELYVTPVKTYELGDFYKGGN